MGASPPDSPRESNYDPERLLLEDEQLQRDIRELENTPAPEPVDEAAARQRAARRSERGSVIAGLVALVLAFVALQYVAALPSGLLLLDVVLAWGYVNFIRLMARRTGFEPDNGFIAALIPVLAIPTLTLFLASEHGIQLPLGLRYSVAFPVLLLAVTSTILFLLRPKPERMPAEAWKIRVLSTGLLTVGIPALLLLALALGAPNVQAGAWPTLALTALVVVAALTLQANAHKFLPWRHAKILGSAPALALTATQLLDGTVSYLAVGNPLHLLAQPSHEQMAVSAFLIEWTGPGYILAKWALAILLVRILDGPAMRHRLAEPSHRFMLYVIMAYVGMGPAIFSTARLFL